MLESSGFGRVVCGVDGSAESIEGLRQALGLRAPDGRLVAVTVRNLATATHAGAMAPRAAERIEEEAAEAQAKAQEALGSAPGAEARIVDGRHPAQALLSVAVDEEATLIAVGAPSLGRAEGILLGDTATTLLHDAPCSVLVARGPWEAGQPRSIVVGFDGSEQARAALAVGGTLGERFEAPVRVLAAGRGKPLEQESLAGVDELEHDDRSPVDALIAASEEADLIVIGSRGMHGVRALGSVSERVAHRATSSVLVVRPAAGTG